MNSSRTWPLVFGYFSLPSLAYFTTQFDAETIDLYGVASQLSTIEKWQKRKKTIKWPKE